MNKFIFILFIGLISVNLFAQKVVENPEFGFSSLPGKISKIELLEASTIVHFDIKGLVGTSIFIPKKSYIQDAKGKEKFFVTKVEGGKMGENVFPDSGELNYALVFPKLDAKVNSIDFGEANDGGTWFVYDIIINEEESASLLPKELKGNWMLTDGSNRWDYGFNANNAILNKTLWKYKSIKSKGKKYIITLEREDKVKVVYAKLSKDGTVSFGEELKKLTAYSLEKTKNPNYKLLDDTIYKEDIFKVGSVTYSGVIKGYTKKANQKTGTVYVNNVFTGNQEMHLVKISNDGTFSISLPIAYPQSILVRLLGFQGEVFVEPGKEVFHYLNGNQSLFMGDLAQVNSNLLDMKSIRYFDYRKTMDKIGTTSPKDYKKVCFDVRDKELEALNIMAKEQFISQKALQIKRLSINYGALERIAGYGMYRSSLERRNKQAKNAKQKKPFEKFVVDKSYYDFATKEVTNNKIAVLTSSYNYFINRLLYADIFRKNKANSYTLAELANLLQEDGKKLSEAELDMVKASRSIETEEIQLKKAKHREIYGKTEQAFYKKYANDYMAYSKESKQKPKHSNFILNIVDFIKSKGETLNKEELQLVEAVKVLKTEKENEDEQAFYETHGVTHKAFHSKYKKEIGELYKNKYNRDRDESIKSFFGDSKGFMMDVIELQNANKKLEDYQVYNDAELIVAQQKINNPFVSKYLSVLNKNTKEKIIENKTKGGYHVNQVDKTEGDELFDAMLEKFKGKVVYVDFWATWCGPCKSGIKRIAPLKEEMKNEDVVFLYITNQTSPEGTWKNAIPDIKGEHYRVSKDEWNYLSSKFKITGIPHYTLVDKTGNVIKEKMGHLSNDRLKTVLKAAMKK